MSKITKATVKSFIRKSGENLTIVVKSHFDGTADCCEPTKQKFFVPAKFGASFPENTMGIVGAWFVGGGRDYFKEYDSENFIGYEVYNCCGTFILAVQK